MDDDLAEFYVHTVTVEPFLGDGAFGDTFGPPQTLAPPNGVFISPSRRLVRGKDGDQIISEHLLVTAVTNAPVFTPDAKVTYDGTVSRVIVAQKATSGDVDLPDHVQVSLT